MNLPSHQTLHTEKPSQDPSTSKLEDSEAAPSRGQREDYSSFSDSSRHPTGKFFISPAEEFQQMLGRQTLNRWYNRNLNNRKQRINVVFGLMQKVCQILELELSTFCLSVNVFDAVISKYPVEVSQMVPLGMIAVLLASKMNETHEKVISLSDISKYLIPLDVKVLASMEKKVFTVLNFQLNMVLPENFICFLLHLFLNEESGFFGDLRLSSDLISRFLGIVNYLNLLTLVDYTFYKYTSIAVAVSILIQARNMLGLKEVWPEFLKTFTGISEDHVAECLNLIQMRYKDKFVMKIFQKIDAENRSSPQPQLLNPTLAKDSTFVVSEKFFMSDETIHKYIKSLKTMDSFRKASKHC